MRFIAQKDKMLLAVDVGNTTISLGLFRGNRLILRTSIPTKECGKEFGGRIERLLPPMQHRGRNDNVIAVVGSVVPKIDISIKNALRDLRIKCLRQNAQVFLHPLPYAPA